MFRLAGLVLTCLGYARVGSSFSACLGMFRLDQSKQAELGLSGPRLLDLVGLGSACLSWARLGLFRMGWSQ